MLGELCALGAVVLLWVLFRKLRPDGGVEYSNEKWKEDPRVEWRNDHPVVKLPDGEAHPAWAESHARDKARQR